MVTAADREFVVWTVLKPPKSTSAPNPDHSPPNALVYWELPNDVRLHRTMIYVKTRTALYTIGPLDFCGHARAIRLGNGGWVIAVCDWDPTLPFKDQIFIKRVLDANGAWPPGFRKTSQAQLLKNIAQYNKVCNEMKKTDLWRGKTITQSDVKAVIADRKSKQEKKRAQTKAGKREKALKDAERAAVRRRKKTEAEASGSSYHSAPDSKVELTQETFNRLLICLVLFVGVLALENRRAEELTRGTSFDNCIPEAATVKIVCGVVATTIVDMRRTRWTVVRHGGFESGFFRERLKNASDCLSSKIETADYLYYSMSPITEETARRKGKRGEREKAKGNGYDD
ncbi:hypothetical protein R3P38DRAFT_2786642 [Favolaschia claudopus]|uniref:Uncharacterized protein n=1 Tax=Favolaschia claudopus TaxID=2862362 RepID=A0AAW0ARR0_9AGAR